MSKQPSRRERKKQETRQRLLECAWKQFLEKGYDETTVEDVTEAADVAKGTFFNYFATKEAVLDELALWRLNLLGRQMRAATDVPQSAVARIKHMLCAITDELFPESDLPRHLLLARISAPVKHQSAYRLGSMMRELVERGQESGEIRADIDADLIARLLMTSVFYQFMRAHPGRIYPDGTPLPQEIRLEQEKRKRNAQFEPDLEAKLIESVDKLLDGLGGPNWRTM